MNKSQIWVKNTVLRGSLLLAAALAISSGCAGFVDGACYVGDSCTVVSQSACSLQGGDFKGNQKCGGTPRSNPTESQISK